MANVSTKYLMQACNDAKQYTEQYINDCETLSNAYVEKDKFYKKLTTKEIVFTVLYFVVGIAALIFRGLVFGYVEQYIYKLWDFGAIKNLVMTLYIAGAIGLMLLGAWNVFLLFYAQKAQNDICKMKRGCDELRKEIATLDSRFNKMADRLFVAPSEFAAFNASEHEKELGKYKEKVETINTTTRKYKLYYYGAVFTLLFMFQYIFLGRFAVESFATGYTYQTTVVLICSYMLVMVLLYKFQYCIHEYAKKYTRLIAVGVFLVYQIMMAVSMAQKTLFTPLINIPIEEAAKELPNWVVPVLSFALKFLLTKGGIILIITSIIIVMYIAKTNIERELEALKNGVQIPMDDGSKRMVSPDEIKSGNKLVFVFAAAYALIIPKFMSSILINGASFGRVILYLIFGAVWFGISASFSGDEKDIAYGKRLKWVKNAFFFSYMFLTLALVPGFGLGSIILILVQSVLSLIALGILAAVV